MVSHIALLLIVLLQNDIGSSLMCYNCSIIDFNCNESKVIACGEDPNILAYCFTYALENVTYYKYCQEFYVYEEEKHKLSLDLCARHNQYPEEHCKYCLEDLCNGATVLQKGFVSVSKSFVLLVWISIGKMVLQEFRVF